MDKTNQLSTLNSQLTKSKEFSMKNALNASKMRLIGTLSRWLCAIAFVVIIGFTLTAAGCNNGTTGGDGSNNNNNNVTIWDVLDLTSGIPPDSYLVAVGLSSGALNSIATGSGYMGYEYDSSRQPSLYLYYKGKTMTDFNKMKTELETVTSKTFTENYHDDEAWCYDVQFSDYYYGIVVALKDFDDGGIITPKGFMQINLVKYK
jgi:hypothetical protein